MSQAPLRRPFTLVAGAALTVFLLLRSGVLIWVWQHSPADGSGTLVFLWTVDTLASTLILATLVAACGWLITGARRKDQEKSRVEHLAEVGLLAGGLAHEIRNTLNAMHSQLALLRKQIPAEADSQAGHRASQIERAFAELDELVTDFLAFARPAQDRLEEVDLMRLIGDVLEFAALDLEQGCVKVVTDFPSSLSPVFADAGKLRRSLLNLIINARQAMPDGGTLTVRLRPTEKDEVAIEVSDTGCGISGQDRERIFQAFFSTKPGGTGLGLAVVRRTIEDCGGQIAFVSEVGRGTTFRIQLPTAKSRRAARGGTLPRALSNSDS